MRMTNQTMNSGLEQSRGGSHFSDRSSTPESVGSTVSPTTEPESYLEPEPETRFSLPVLPKRSCEVLDVDKKTPDSHVPRDSRLIRLTGVHPFNSEAPLSKLFDEGFLTSSELFYVRNHGAVPLLADEDSSAWELTIEGLVEQPLKLSLQQLKSEYTNVTYPVTLVCAGNRRKEQNQVRKSKGFSWGSAGVSTSLFTGVAMADVIRNARPLKNAKYVYMEGSDKLPNGCYGTSVKLSWVMDPERGIMLAHRMNGEPLRPDHGKPLRAVIPGQIGGRSVKWLTKLVLTDTPSDNWYHIYDNRVLPTSISPDIAANNPKLWMDERYAIYDLSPNSVIVYPAHGEQLRPVHDSETYTVKGYAYSGGGRRVSRVEISLDKGCTWILADINYGEDRYRGISQSLFGGELSMSRDTCFCWCFWEVQVACSSLVNAKDIVVRATDEGMCVQPRDMYWNVLGMMNNPWFRVAIGREGDSLSFEHPTQPALQPGGWMERVKQAGGSLTDGFWGESPLPSSDKKPEAPVQENIRMTDPNCKRMVAINELKEHEGEECPWFVVKGEVYDGRPFLKEHPGGAQSIYSVAGTDSTDEFMAIHSETAKAMLADYHIGTLDELAKAELSTSQVAPTPSSEPRPLFLQSKSWSTAKLRSKSELSWDSRLLEFELDYPEQKLGLPIGQHLMIRLRDPVTRETIIRSYTPISEQEQNGSMRVLLKVYFASANSVAGAMSTALNSLPIGHEVDFKGPTGKFEYLGKGAYSLNGTQHSAKAFLMICGGSGITPIFQVFRAVMRDEEDKTKCVVFNCNRRREDILCKDELDSLTDFGRGRGTVQYTLTQPDEDWAGIRGRVDGEMVSRFCVRTPETVALICGPPGMEKSLGKYLAENGWPHEQVIFF